MHRGCHINYLVGALTRHHHVDFGGYGLLAKLELIDDARTFSKLFDFFPGAVVECLAWADGSAHRFPVRRCSVVAHIAFHHQIEVTHHLGYAEWTRQDAIGTGNTPWFACSHDAAILTPFDGIRGADIGASASRSACTPRERSAQIGCDPRIPGGSWNVLCASRTRNMHGHTPGNRCTATDRQKTPSQASRKFLQPMTYC